MLYTAVAHAVLAAWGLLLTSTAGTQPIVASACVGAGANIYKLQQIFPPGPSSSDSGNNSGRAGPVLELHARCTLVTGTEC